MPFIRNPFRKGPGDIITDPNGKPMSSPLSSPQQQGRPTSIDIKQPAEYKLSEINDSGVFLPPSPSAKEKPRFFSQRSTTSTSSSSYRSALTEDDNPFCISRESFDGYRRSFDISARSPVADQEAFRTRRSVDAAHLRIPPPRLGQRHVNPPETQPEERFEDVVLSDETAKPTKKQGIFSRFSSGQPTSDGRASADAPRPSSSHFTKDLFGRKRAQSGSSHPPEELGTMSKSQEMTGMKNDDL